MKIYTITCHAVQNHGACLQAYALMTYLQNLGHEVEIIDYRPKGLYSGYSLWACPNRYKNRTLLRLLYIVAKLPFRLMLLPRRWKFEKFVQQYLNISPNRYESFEQLRKNNLEGDLFICGSDQIWNTYYYCGTDRAFYLDFIDDKSRKVSYGASFGFTSIKAGYEDFVSQKLSNLNAISVREESGKEIVTSLGLNSTLVVDSVLLLPYSHWKSLVVDRPHEKFILVYDFENSELIRDIALRLAELKNLKIYSIGASRLSYANKNFRNKGPLDFLQLAYDAEYIIGNSFHAVLFSIIFKKEFFIVRREDGLNSRMEDILRRYNLITRAVVSQIDDNKLLEKIDYNNMLEQLNIDIERSKSFISEQILLAGEY